MLDPLREQLLEKPGLYQGEMAVLLYDEFGCSYHNVKYQQAVASVGWTKATRHAAKERNADLRDFCLYKLSEFRPCHFVYVDDSRCDKRIGFRRAGWYPLDIAPVPGS